MKRLNNVFLITGLLLLFYSCSENRIHCTLEGTLVDRDSDTIIVLKATEDVRFADTFMIAKDHQFEFELNIVAPEAYELIFWDEAMNGAWRPIVFIAEEGSVEFKLYPTDRFGENIILGGTENENYSSYSKVFDSIFSPRFQPLNDRSRALWDNGGYHSDKMNKVLVRLRATDDSDTLALIYEEMEDLRASREHLSPAALSIQDSIDLINDEAVLWQYVYMKNNLSIAMYYLLIRDLRNTYSLIEVKKEQIREIFPAFSEKYPDHPYTSMAKDLIYSMDHITLGEQFVDFTAPDLDSNQMKLSAFVKSNKITLLDLWASWCSPCIAKAKSMIPVYNEYKEKGFGILGVAMEYESTEDMERIMELHSFNWPNLVDLDGSNNIWQKYGIPGSGGGTFLILNNGEIIAVDPTAEEVRKILEERLN